MDFTSIYVLEEPVDLMPVIEEIPFSECYEEALLKKCQELGITKANAAVSILNEAYAFDDPAKSFTGLKFVEVFPYTYTF